MIDDVLLTEQIVVLVAGVADLGEDVVGFHPAPFGDFAGEILAHEGPAIDAALHGGEGQRLADHANRRRDHVAEGLVDFFGFAAPRHAEETGGGEIEGEGLDRWVEVQRFALRPLRQPAGDAFIQLGEIMLHRLGLEGDAQCFAMDAMLFEIHQHQPAREQQFQHRIPAQFARKNLVLVEQDHLVGFRADHRNAPAAEILAAHDAAMLLEQFAAAAERVGEELQRAQDRKARRDHAGDMLKLRVGRFRQIGRDEFALGDGGIHGRLPLAGCGGEIRISTARRNHSGKPPLPPAASPG